MRWPWLVTLSLLVILVRFSAKCRLITRGERFGVKFGVKTWFSAAVRSKATQLVAQLLLRHENPAESELFQKVPKLLDDKEESVRRNCLTCISHVLHHSIPANLDIPHLTSCLLTALDSSQEWFWGFFLRETSLFRSSKFDLWEISTASWKSITFFIKVKNHLNARAG